MKYVALILFTGLILFSPVSGAQKVSRQEYLKKVLNIIGEGNYVLGSRELYRLSRSKYYKSKRIQMKYTLGIAFLEMKLYHLASLQFVYIVKNTTRGLYRKKALEKLGFILDFFSGDSLFCSLSQYIKPFEYPNSVSSELNFYFGNCAFKKGNFKKAHSYLSKVKAGTPSYNKAMYLRGLAYAEKDEVKRAAEIFKDLASYQNEVNSTTRAAALMGLSRVLYQGKKFESSIRAYRQVPRDTIYFHASLTENSWNFLQSGKFRSALSNFQTLHSLYYKNYYQPESFILRAYVYLYICKYPEMEKTLDYFKKVYTPLLKEVTSSLKWKKTYKSYVRAALRAFVSKEEGIRIQDSELPEVVLRRVMQNSEFLSVLEYLEKLKEEQRIVEGMPSQWRSDRVGRNASFILKKRIGFVEKQAGKAVRKTLIAVQKELRNLFQSEQYLRYDMLKGKGDLLKKKISKKYLDKVQIDDKITRSYYIQNGYEYWPFDGETWLDELGSYHYLGRQNCE